MGVAQTNTKSLFSLRLEQGVGRLVLLDRSIADLLVVEEMCLDLEEVPNHLDMTAGVEALKFLSNTSFSNREWLVPRPAPIGTGT